MLRYFLSGASGIRPDVMPEVAALVDYRLLSMHEAFKGNTKVWCAVSHHKKSAMKEVMLDSGAFTAFTKGKKVVLEDLIAIYKDTISKLDTKRIKNVWLINLDVIPGEYGRISTTKEIEDALDQSDKNFKVLRKTFGDRVLPVFHQTESDARLAEVCKQNHFIALGFRQDFSEQHRITEAEKNVQFAHSKGIEVHGLATTGYKMLRRVPFDTVDSATWLYVAAMGKIIFVDEFGEVFDIPISERSPMQRDLRQHYRTLAPEERAFIDKRIKEVGVTLEQLEKDLSYRILFCAHQLREWLRSYNRPKLRVEKGLFA